MEDLEKCEMINFNNSIQEMKNNIVYFNLPNNEMNTDIEEEFSNEKKFNEIKNILDKKEKKKELEYEKPTTNQIFLYNSYNEEKINYNHLDCVEYGLKDEHIICTKYE